MGLLRIQSDIPQDTINVCKAWLIRECNAHIKLLRSNEFIKLYSIEGEGIPEGEKDFSIKIEPLVDNVVMVTINE